MASQIPPLLESYLALPPETSQLVLTGILGASTNWLVLRFLYSLLKKQPRQPNKKRPTTESPGGGGKDHDDDGTGAVVVVVLVSFMRDYAFWKEGAGRLGLHLDTLPAKFHFVDGLSRLFLHNNDAAAAAAAAAVGSRAGGAAAGKGGVTVTTTYLESPRLADVARALHAVVDQAAAAATARRAANNSKVILVLDQPDVLLAAAGPGGGVTSTALRELVLDLREKTHATLLTVAADEPLVSSQATTLEKEHAAFVLSLAHEAEAVLSLRMLDTGTAKDVSGVLRVTRGGGDVLDRAIDEHEYLYHVGGDGGVKVLERG